MVMSNLLPFNYDMELHIDIMQKIKNFLWKDKYKNGSILKDFSKTLRAGRRKCSNDYTVQNFEEYIDEHSKLVSGGGELENISIKLFFGVRFISITNVTSSYYIRNSLSIVDDSTPYECLEYLEEIKYPCIFIYLKSYHHPMTLVNTQSFQ